MDHLLPVHPQIKILEYLSISNINTNYISKNEKFKFIDDLSILEKINLLSIGLSSYNFQLHVASDIIQDGYFIDSTNLKTQEHLGSIAEWTKQSPLQETSSQLYKRLQVLYKTRT